MGHHVDHHNGVRGNFRVVAFDVILVGPIQVVLCRFLDDNCLGERRRLRLQKLRQDIEEGFRGRTVDGDQELR